MAIDGGLEILVGYQSFGVAAQTEDTYHESCASDDRIGSDDFLQGGAGEIIVGAEDRELRSPEHGSQCVETVVELVVAECDGVVTHPVHRVYLYTSVVEIEIRCTLTEITGIQQQQIRVRLAFLSDETHSTCVAALAVGFGLDLRVGVVGVQDSQMVRLRRTGHQKDNVQSTKDNVQRSKDCVQ